VPTPADLPETGGEARLSKVSPPGLGSAHWLNELLAADPGDTRCDLAFQPPHRYAGRRPDRRGRAAPIPGVAARLAICQPDYQGLRAAIGRLAGALSSGISVSQMLTTCHPCYGSPNFGPPTLMPRSSRKVCAAASVATVAKVGRFVLPGFVVTVIWIVLIILVIILLAWIVHLAGGGLFELRLGHFRLQIGVT
jgi:hypothetical protein